MGLAVVPATPVDEPKLRSLIQFFYYEFTTFKNWDLEDDGKFIDRAIGGCWENQGRIPFLFMLDGKIAGFAIVENRLTDSRAVHEITEFFVLARYQLKRVGLQASHILFDWFPGYWEVRVASGNTRAQVFWRKAIEQYPRLKHVHVAENEQLFSFSSI